MIVVELTCVGVQSSFSAWCQLHYGDMYAVVHFCCCAPPFSVFCCPRLSLRLHSLLTSMVSPPTYGSHLEQAFVRKRSFTPMMLPKVWGFCRAQPHCDSTMTSAILPLLSSPEPPKSHVSVVIDARRRFPKFQMFQSRWPPAPRLPRGGEASHWKRWIRSMEESRDFPCVLLCVVQIFKYLIWIWRFEFQSMKFPLSISSIFKWRRLEPCNCGANHFHLTTVVILKWKNQLIE